LTLKWFDDIIYYKIFHPANDWLRPSI